MKHRKNQDLQSNSVSQTKAYKHTDKNVNSSQIRISITKNQPPPILYIINTMNYIIL